MDFLCSGLKKYAVKSPLHIDALHLIAEHDLLQFGAGYRSTFSNQLELNALACQIFRGHIERRVLLHGNH